LDNCVFFISTKIAFYEKVLINSIKLLNVNEFFVYFFKYIIFACLCSFFSFVGYSYKLRQYKVFYTLKMNFVIIQAKAIPTIVISAFPELHKEFNFRVNTFLMILKLQSEKNFTNLKHTKAHSTNG